MKKVLITLIFLFIFSLSLNNPFIAKTAPQPSLSLLSISPPILQMFFPALTPSPHSSPCARETCVNVCFRNFKHIRLKLK